MNDKIAGILMTLISGKGGVHEKTQKLNHGSSQKEKDNFQKQGEEDSKYQTHGNEYNIHLDGPIHDPVNNWLNKYHENTDSLKNIIIWESLLQLFNFPMRFYSPNSKICGFYAEILLHACCQMKNWTFLKKTQWESLKFHGKLRNYVGIQLHASW